MGRQQTLVQLSDELLAALDQRAATSGRSRSDIIRTALEQFLREDREARIDEAVRAGYERFPPEPDGWAERAGRASINAEPW